VLIDQFYFEHHVLNSELKGLAAKYEGDGQGVVGLVCRVREKGYSGAFVV
jgi:hypothetical protein